MVLISTASGPGRASLLGNSGVEMPDALMGRCASPSVWWFLVGRTGGAGAAAARGCDIRFRSAGPEG